MMASEQPRGVESKDGKEATQRCPDFDDRKVAVSMVDTIQDGLPIEQGDKILCSSTLPVHG